MTQLLVLMSVAWPLALAAVSIARCRKSWLGVLVASAPLPAILLATVGEQSTLELPWVLMGSRFGLDTTGQVFLGVTAVLWLAAGVYSHSYMSVDPHRWRFDSYFLLTMVGNFGVSISQDMVSFLFFFTLMSFSAYGLITHSRDEASIRAGRVYISFTVAAEILLFWAISLCAFQCGSVNFEVLPTMLAQSSSRHLIAGLLIAGFGIKLGLMPLHFWLPLAHPAAPTPASAVLSATMIKTGLLGMLRFLPLGEVAMFDVGAIVIVAGIATAILAAVIGLMQDNSKAVLAYSSVSQMGLIAIGLGTGLMAPENWRTILAMLLLYVTHHAFAKGALFLGVGICSAKTDSKWLQVSVMTGMVIASLSLAGLPFTSGLTAKVALKYAAATAPVDWALMLKWLLPLTGITTTLLLSRFLWLVWPGRHQPHGKISIGMLASWGALILGVLLLPVGLRFSDVVKPAWLSLSPNTVWAACWPIGVAGLIVLGAWPMRKRSSALSRFKIPPGDLVIPLTVVLRAIKNGLNDWATERIPQMRTRAKSQFAVPAKQTVVLLFDKLTVNVEGELVAGISVAIVSVILLLLMLS